MRFGALLSKSLSAVARRWNPPCREPHLNLWYLVSLPVRGPVIVRSLLNRPVHRINAECGGKGKHGVSQ